MKKEIFFKLKKEKRKKKKEIFFENHLINMGMGDVSLLLHFITHTKKNNLGERERESKEKKKRNRRRPKIRVLDIRLR